MLNETAILTIVTPTIGNKDYLRRNILSIQNQKMEENVDYKHLIVIDGKKYKQNVDEVIAELKVEDKVNVLCLPENTGYEKWLGHRIYGSISYLLNSRYVSFLDEDNFVNENYVNEYIKIMKAGVDWGYTLRNIVDKTGEFICKDECESMGYIRNTWDTKNPFIDLNCCMIKTQLMIQLAPLLYRKARDPNVEEIDRILTRALMQIHLTSMCTNRHTVNYMIGNRADSVKKEYFLYGNKVIQNEKSKENQ